MEDLKSIRTEQRNPETMHIDELSTLDMVRLINREDHRVAEAVAHVCPQIAQAVDIIAASGRTPYVIGAMEYAKSLGGVTIGVTCCPGSEIDTLAEVGIAPMPGPEVVTGSTRMKSGTAQKMVLNMLSTCTMIRLGKVYGNLMVDVKPSNEKLIRRCVSIVCAAAECDEAAATAVLEQCGYHPKIAIVMLLCGCTAEEAEKRLAEKDGYIARVVG